MKTCKLVIALLLATSAAVHLNTQEVKTCHDCCEDMDCCDDNAGTPLDDEVRAMEADTQASRDEERAQRNADRA